MSREGMEIAGRMYAAWNEGGPAAAAALYHPNVEWHEAAEVPDAGITRGREAVVTYLNQWVGLFGPTRVEVEELVPLDADCVLSVFRFHVEGAASGIAGDDEGFHLLRFSDGMLRSCRVFRSRGDALKAAGLRE
jgi:ketosteroid isomerase-like protein